MLSTRGVPLSLREAICKLRCACAFPAASCVYHDRVAKHAWFLSADAGRLRLHAILCSLPACLRSSLR